MTEKEKMIAGLLYDAAQDPELLNDRMRCKGLCRKYNDLYPDNLSGREEILKQILGDVEGNILIEQPFYCDYGYNISVGSNFYANHNLIILDEAYVTFGDNVFIAPDCGFYTAWHPFNIDERNKGLEYAKPIKVGNNVWIGGKTCVLPGVTIGNNCVIGAGSVVNKDIPDNSVAVGNPCKVIKTLNN